MRTSAWTILVGSLVGTWCTVWMTAMPGANYRGRPPAASEEALALGRALAVHVGHLAGEIGERNQDRREGLEAARLYVARRLGALGLGPVFEEFEVGGESFANVVAEIPGASRSGEIVLFGAHYDTATGSPGADDNASGVAALLELARLATESATPCARTLRFVAFANEEPPFFGGPDMGSAHHARALRARGADVVAMLSLESLGCFSDEPGSQSYPFPFSLLYPERGDFLAFVGDLSSRGLVRDALGSFRAGTPIPSEGLASLGFLPGVGWSDQLSFWRSDYPGLMVTDTALFRNPTYHRAGDTPEKLDYLRMAHAVLGLERVMGELAGGTDG